MPAPPLAVSHRSVLGAADPKLPLEDAFVCERVGKVVVYRPCPPAPVARSA